MFAAHSLGQCCIAKNVSTSNFPRNSLNNKTILRILGGVLSCAGVAYVALRLSDYASDISLDHVGLYGFLGLGFCVLVYACINVFLAIAWRELLQHFEQNISVDWAIKTFGVSQIAKYVPGNIFHIAGRHAIGSAEGLSNSALLKSAMWELLLLALSGGVFALLVLPLVTDEISTFLAFIFFCFIIVICSVLLRYFLSKHFSRAYLLYLLFMISAGLLFVLQISIVCSVNLDLSSLFIIVPSYIVAWLAGFLTPGAPAGVGVRELVLLFLLKGIIPESELLLTVVIARAITALGDVCYFLFAISIQRRSKLR